MIANWLVPLSPLLAGAIIAAWNADGVNAATERAEAWVRQAQARAASGDGWFRRWVLNPVLRAVVMSCNWTDGLEHRGIKNGLRVAATIYLVGAWLLVLHVALAITVALVVIAIVLAFATRNLPRGDDGGDSERPRVRDDDRRDARFGPAVRGTKFYRGTSWFNEELKGRVDDDGIIYSGTNWFNEERIGRIDDAGTIYRGTTTWNEEKVGRIDKDGTLYRGDSWWSERHAGRVDEEGRVHAGASWLNERRTGRVGE